MTENCSRSLRAHWKATSLLRRSFMKLGPLALALSIAIGVGWPAAAGAEPGRVPPVAVNRDEDAVRAYWTGARLRNASPREYVINEQGRVERGVPAIAAKRPGTTTPTPTSTPSPSPAVKGALFPSNSDPVAWAVGKAYFTMGGIDYVCSATVVNAGTQDRIIVLTAGHCAYDETLDGPFGFAENWMFIRNYDLGDASFAGCASLGDRCWVANALVVPQNWAEGTSSDVHWESDFAFAIFLDQAERDAYSSMPFSYPLATATVPQTVHAFGYPAAGKYDGTQLAYCAGSTVPDPYQDTVGFTSWGVACDMTGGSSGGGWLRNYYADAALVSVNSYGYRGGPYKGYMFGPVFGEETLALLSRAITASSNAYE